MLLLLRSWFQRARRYDVVGEILMVNHMLKKKDVRNVRSRGRVEYVP